MPQSRPELRRGRIVWARIADHNGVFKDRPLIILTATADIPLDESIDVMAITTTFPDPPSADVVELPWHPQGRVMTKLRKRSAAVLPWVDEILTENVLQYYGDVPPKLMIEILNRLAT